MANIYLEEDTKERLNKALGEMAAAERAVISFNGAVSRLLDLYEKQPEVKTQ